MIFLKAKIFALSILTLISGFFNPLLEKPKEVPKVELTPQVQKIIPLPQLTPIPKVIKKSPPKKLIPKLGVATGFPDVNTSYSNIISLEDSWKATREKYQQIFPTTSGDYSYRVDEYVSGNGRAGYLIIFQYTKAGTTYQKRVDNGIEPFRNQDWIQIDERSKF